jgi:hypothetical protein
MFQKAGRFLSVLGKGPTSDWLPRAFCIPLLGPHDCAVTLTRTSCYSQQWNRCYYCAGHLKFGDFLVNIKFTHLHYQTTVALGQRSLGPMVPFDPRSSNTAGIQRGPKKHLKKRTYTTGEGREF